MVLLISPSFRPSFLLPCLTRCIPVILPHLRFITSNLYNRFLCQIWSNRSQPRPKLLVTLPQRTLPIQPNRASFIMVSKSTTPITKVRQVFIFEARPTFLTIAQSYFSASAQRFCHINLHPNPHKIATFIVLIVYPTVHNFPCH